MHTMLAAVEVPDRFNADYYIAVVTILPILMLAVEALIHFADSFPPEAEDKWPRPLFYLISFFYLFTPVIAALGVVLGILALMFRDANGIYQWSTFSCLVGVLAFLAIASTVYLSAFDKERQKNRNREGATSFFERVLNRLGRAAERDRPSRQSGG
jgi:hypothetical protein